MSRQRPDQSTFGPASYLIGISFFCAVWNRRLRTRGKNILFSNPDWAKATLQFSQDFDLLSGSWPKSKEQIFARKFI
jgi:hypothetical protein